MSCGVVLNGSGGVDGGGYSPMTRKSKMEMSLREMERYVGMLRSSRRYKDPQTQGD